MQGSRAHGTRRRTGGRAVLMAMAATAVLAGCGTGGGAGPVGATHLPASMEESGEQINLQLTRDERGLTAELEGGAADVWAQLPEVYGDLGIDPDVIDVAGRRYGSGTVTGLRVGSLPMHEVVRCGAQATGLQSSTRMRVTLSVVSTVEAISEGHSLLRTRITGSGSRIDGTSTGAIACVSTGRLEQRIAGLVRLALASASVRR